MKTLAKSALIAALLGSVAIGAPALAKGRMGQMFEQMDTNGDGFVDKAEVTAAQDERFATADANGDGALSAEEMAAARDTAREGHDRGPKDGHPGGATFGEIDTNSDSAISPEEFEAARTKRAEQFRAHMGERRARMIERMDTNKDGLIQKEELGGGFAERMFERLDTDKDGRISKAEAEAARGGWHHRKGKN